MNATTCFGTNRKKRKGLLQSSAVYDTDTKTFRKEVSSGKLSLTSPLNYACTLTLCLD